MKELALSLFMTCIGEFFPNKPMIQLLTKEQQEVMYTYAKYKCEAQVNQYLNMNEVRLLNPELGEQDESIIIDPSVIK